MAKFIIPDELKFCEQKFLIGLKETQGEMVEKRTY